MSRGWFGIYGNNDGDWHMHLMHDDDDVVVSDKSFSTLKFEISRISPDYFTPILTVLIHPSGQRYGEIILFPL